MRLSQAVAKARTIEVEFDGGATLEVAYRPASYTVRELEVLAADERDPKRIVDSMLRTLVSWDLTDDGDQPIPLETDALMDVPTPVFVTIMRAMQRDQVDDTRAEGKG